MVVFRSGPTGAPDSTFDGDGYVTMAIGTGASAQGVALQADGKIVIAGSGSADFAVVRYNSDGSLDTTFGTDGIATTDLGNQEVGKSIAVQPDGRIVIAGQIWDGHTNDFAIIRYNTDGSLDTTFGTDGKVVLDVGTDDALQCRRNAGHEFRR
jgi:uncharacterized delta-60 repeat protein